MKSRHSCDPCSASAEGLLPPGAGHPAAPKGLPHHYSGYLFTPHGKARPPLSSSKYKIRSSLLYPACSASALIIFSISFYIFCTRGWRTRFPWCCARATITSSMFFHYSSATSVLMYQPKGRTFQASPAMTTLEPNPDPGKANITKNNVPGPSIVGQQKATSVRPLSSLKYMSL